MLIANRKVDILLALVLVLAIQGACFTCQGLSPTPTPTSSRRDALGRMVGAACAAIVTSTSTTQLTPAACWAASAVQDSVNVDSFLRTGMDAGGNMGVSSQAGKSRPETGVILRDGYETSRDPRTGDVLAELLLQTPAGTPMAAFVSYSSPWSLATGSYFDVECRDAKTGDGVFLQVTTSVGGKSIQALSDSFLLDNLLAATGRFSFYGQPTDVKVKKSRTDENGYRIIDFSFSNLSQSTQTEIPRKARLVATIPAGSTQAVMLIGSASATRWNKGSDKLVASTAESFRAIAAPTTGLKLRRKERSSFLILDEEQ